MNLPKDLIARVRFARFCHEHGVNPADAAELIALARRAFHAGERACNISSDRVRRDNERTGERFEAAAQKLGFVVSWPGLWPRLERDGREIYLPD